MELGDQGRLRTQGMTTRDAYEMMYVEEVRWKDDVVRPCGVAKALSHVKSNSQFTPPDATQLDGRVISAKCRQTVMNNSASFETLQSHRRLQ